MSQQADAVLADLRLSTILEQIKLRKIRDKTRRTDPPQFLMLSTCRSHQPNHIGLVEGVSDVAKNCRVLHLL